MNRLTYNFLKSYSGLIYWLNSRITAVGTFLLVSLIISAMLGMDTNSTMAYQVFTFILSLILIALISLPFFKGRFSIKRDLPLMATAGKTFSYRLSLQNGSNRTRKGLTIIETLADPRPSYETFLENISSMPPRSLLKKMIFGRGYFSYWNRLLIAQKMARPEYIALDNISGKGELKIIVHLTPLRRGYMRFEGARIAGTDPFGLFRAFTATGRKDSLLVLPRRYRLPAIRLEGKRQYHQGGVSLASKVGDADEFMGLRDYRPGDPLRTIHWKSWAKSGRPVVKEYESEFFSRHALILDTFSDSFAGAADDEIFEEAISVAASFASTIETGESMLDLIFVGDEAHCYTMGRSLGTPALMLETLACAAPCRDKAFEMLANFITTRAAMMSSAICILLKWDDERREMVRRLKGHGIPLMVFIIAPPGSSKTDGSKAGTSIDTIHPGPMKDSPDKFHILQVGKIEEALSRI
jgi:uncharacterized protein (DUF58 family)